MVARRVLEADAARPEPAPARSERLRTLLTRLCDHPAEIDAKSPAALRRAHEQFTWRAKAAQVTQVYDWLLRRRPDRPHFPMPTPDLD